MNQLNSNQSAINMQFSQLKNATWQQQVEIIQNLKINQNLVKLINIRNYSIQIADLFVAGSNPRSKLINSLCSFLIELFSAYAMQLVSFANLLISPQYLLRLLGSGNKIISSSVNQLIKCIITHTDFTFKNKYIKFVDYLENQFLTSKNNYVREKISMYFLVIADSDYYQSNNQERSLIQFQRTIVRKGIEDASEEVRKNMRLIEQNLNQRQKQNIKDHFIDKLNLKSQNQKSLSNFYSQEATKKNKPNNQQSQNINTSSFSHSIIAQNFKEQASLISIKGKQQNFQVDIAFYLQRMKSGQNWQVKIMSFTEIEAKVEDKDLQIYFNGQTYLDIFKIFISFLAEKRSKLQERACRTIIKIIERLEESNNFELIKFLEQNLPTIIQYSLKKEDIAIQLLTRLIQINPLTFLVKFSEFTVNIKVHKEKLLLLDIILNNLFELNSSDQTKSNHKKQALVVKSMCQNIEKANIKQKDLSLASLAIISHLKNRQPDEVLTMLLCQPQKILNKIIQLSSQIDESLKIAVVSYINSMKNVETRHTLNDKKIKRKTISESIDEQINLITLDLSSSLDHLAQIYLQNIDKLSVEDFKKICVLSQFLYQNDIILELRILLEEICKFRNKKFICAIMQILSTNSQQKIKKSRHNHELMFIDILTSAIRHFFDFDNIRQASNSFDLEIGTFLIKMYRSNPQSLKKRNLIISALMQFPDSLVQQCCNPKQLLLVQTYRVKMKQSNSIQNILAKSTL